MRFTSLLSRALSYVLNRCCAEMVKRTQNKCHVVKTTERSFKKSFKRLAALKTHPLSIKGKLSV